MKWSMKLAGLLAVAAGSFGVVAAPAAALNPQPLPPIVQKGFLNPQPLPPIVD
jgi:hypothetical protein